MNKRLFALLLLSAVTAFAQSKDEPDEAAQPEMPSNLTFETDLYFVEPKLTMSFGTRGLTGTRSSFHGTGHLASVSDINEPTGTLRTYHDGTAGADTRGSSVDNGDGTTSFAPIAPDGKTNSWSFASDAQIVNNGDGIAMHTYTADIQDGGPKTKNPGTTYGVEVAVARDMGKVLRFNWNIVGGFSINDINAKLTNLPTSIVTTTTDVYSLNGQAAPTTVVTTTNSDGSTTISTATYTSPGTTTTTITNADGSTTSATTDTTTLISQDPNRLPNTTTVDTTSVTNRFQLKGAYYTFRAGPTLIWPITQHIRATISAGAALVYAGTTFTVEQDFQPSTGDAIIVTEQNTKNSILPGYYVDANLEYWLTEHAGLYLGAIYQNNGDFTQNLVTAASNYSTRIDLSNLQGFKMGMNVKF